MCFVLYAGTAKPLPRRKWVKDAPDVAVEPLTERESPIRAHFTLPEVQYIGSTSGCGCDFSYVMLQNGEWPVSEDDQEDAESHLQNRQALVSLLRAAKEKIVELYGIWDGDFAVPPQSREDIPLRKLLDLDFHFKEQGFYRVTLEDIPGESQCIPMIRC